jgi:hypothetical protein
LNSVALGMKEVPIVTPGFRDRKKHRLNAPTGGSHD